MTKYLIIWSINPNAWPTDPSAAAQGMEMLYAGIDEGVKSGRILEFGFFLSGNAGYAIDSSDGKDQIMTSFLNYPWIERDVQEIVDYETGKEISRQVKKTQAEQMAAMKR